MRKDGSLTIPGAIVAVLMASACALAGSALTDYLRMHTRIAVLEARCQP